MSNLPDPIDEKGFNEIVDGAIELLDDWLDDTDPMLKNMYGMHTLSSEEFVYWFEQWMMALPFGLWNLWYNEDIDLGSRQKAKRLISRYFRQAPEGRALAFVGYLHERYKQAVMALGEKLLQPQAQGEEVT